jgi:CrcB protein
VQYLVIGLGGFLGANARYLLNLWVAGRIGLTFPWGTLLINVSGSFIIGLFLQLMTVRTALPTEYRLFFATGFLGAYTTFSTFTYESMQLLREGEYLLAFANLGGSLALGLVAVTLGWLLGQLL